MLVFLKPEERLLWKQILRASGNDWCLQRKCSPYLGSTEMSNYAISENCSYDKALPKLPYLPNVFVFFINVDHFVITEKGISFLFDAD